MASWAMHCPDYKVVEWDNDALAKIDNTYVKEAAAEGKWAFVSDYIRLWALYEQGGFYFDSDLEVTAPMDAFRRFSFLTGFERTLDGRRVRPITALMGSVPKDPIIGSLLSEYDDLRFIQNGVPDLTTNTDRITRHLRDRFGVEKSDYGKGEETIFLNEASVIFPYYFFCTPKAGEENYSIHHFNGSWIEPGKPKVIASIGRLRLIKLTYRGEEERALSLRNDDKLVLKLSLGRRALALVKRK